ncbi:protein phosphatase 2C domain-containing protein [bacterium]|nr:protein phosphatase 2C domain-containing protein [bacterium]
MEAEGGADRPRVGPLDPGCVILERYTIDSLLESGAILRYQASREGQPYLLLESRRDEEHSHLSRQRELLGGLSGASFLQPLDFFSHEEFDYAAVAWPGERLEDLLVTQGPMAPEAVEKVLLELLEQLKDLHGQKVLSRSVQPSRIWRNGQGQLVLDLWERACSLERPGQGEEVCSVSPGFSAPEMYGLGDQDVRLDLFSLAAVGYYLLTGQKLHLDSRESFFVIPPPTVVGADGLVKVIMKGLRKRPEDRFAGADEMREALLNPGSVIDEPTPAPTPAPAPAPARPAAAPRNGKASVTAPEVAMLSHIGCVRRINQDACLELRFSFYEKSRRYDGWLVTVIDGMGGEAEGDKAASLALRTLAQELVAADLSLRDGRQTTVLLPDDQDQRCHYLLERALRAANRTIYEYASLDDARRGMGCTITACLLAGSKAYFAQVGDTRGYHGRDRLTQVTTDHSLVGRLVAMGSLTQEEARVSPQRSIIYRALGTNPEVEVDLFDRDLNSGDRIILCSDGVWEYFEADEFENFVMATQSPQELCQKMVDLCLGRGADDNATIAVIQC